MQVNKMWPDVDRQEKKAFDHVISQGFIINYKW